MHDKPQHIERDVTIINTQGLHARPVMRFVDVAGRFSCDIRVRKAGLEVDGKSPMEMMLLEAPKGTALRLIAKGHDAGDATEALATLIEQKFGED